MSRLESRTFVGRADIGSGGRSARPVYDDLAGSALLRRSGKASGAPAHRGDQGTALLASRRKSEREDRVGAQLRDFYQTILREPVPERLTDLVKALEAGGR